MIEQAPSGHGGSGPSAKVETTGRYIITFAGTDTDASSVLASAGLSNVASSRDFRNRETNFTETRDADATVFASLGMAVVSANPEQAAALRKASGIEAAVMSVVPELVHRLLPKRPSAYAHGYRDGVADLTARLDAGNDDGKDSGDRPEFFEDSARSTWGLQATGAISSERSGQGVSVAILDTGFDSSHPDFAGRSISTKSFVDGESAEDGHGHGTHCIGTACGPKSPPTGPRYGIAYEADIFAGKVLGDGGSGNDGGILAGIDWAITNGCAVISMSLGADVAQVHPPYTAAGQRALQQGSLIVAAAGNNAERSSGNFGFVGTPANSPYIIATAALDQQLDLADFSARSAPARGGQIDVAGPGFEVYSSWLMPDRYNTISGTSMATPHAAGVAALWAEATGRRGLELWATIVQEGRRLRAPSVDVGAGLVMAPQ